MKLPQVIAQTGTSASYPQPEASLSAGAAQTRAIAASGGALTGAATDFNTTYANAQEVLRKAEAKVEAETAVNNTEDKFSDFKYSLGQQGVNPDTYHDQLGQGLRDFATEEAKRLKHPESRQAFTLHMQRYARKEMDVARGEALKIRHGLVNTAEDLLMQEYANKAVFGKTPEERQVALRRGMEIPQEGLATVPPRRTPDQVSGMTRTFLGNVQKGQIQRDSRDPELRPGVISTLLNGGYEYIGGPDDQIKLAETLQKHSDQEYKDTREAIDKWFTEQKAMKVSDLFAQASNKTLTVPALELAREEWRLSRTDYAAIQNELTKPADEPTSDPATLLRIDGDVHSQFPRITERNLDALRQEGKLNRKDYLASKDRLRETREGLLNRGETLQMRYHSQAEQEGMADLGIPLLFDKLEPNKDKARSAFLRELRLRSNAYQGQENALAVKDEIIPRYKKFLDQEAQLTVEQTVKALGEGYRDPTQYANDLEARKKAGTITPGDYKAKKALLLDLDTAVEIQKANQRAAEERKATKGGAARPTDRK